MGARLINQPRTRNVGYVDEAPALKISDLRLRGMLFIQGEVGGSTGVAWLRDGREILRRFIAQRFNREMENAIWMLSDLSDAEGQWISLTSKPMHLGGRRWWFICPITGKPCDILYCVGGIFASRAAHRLTYRSQSQGWLDRILSDRDKLAARLEGTPGRGPARGRRRRRAEEQMVYVQRVIDAMGDQICQTGDRRTALARERGKALASRVHDFMVNMRAVPITADNRSVVELYRQYLDVQEPRGKAPPSARRGARVPGEFLQDRPYLDTLVLRKLNYLQEGQIRGSTLGWPKAWVPEPDRQIHFLIDLRDPKRSKALIIYVDPAGLSFQPLWLKRIRGDFGKEELMFVCPEARIATRVLLYQGGRFASAEALTGKDDFDWSEPSPSPSDLGQPRMETPTVADDAAWSEADQSEADLIAAVNGASRSVLFSP